MVAGALSARRVHGWLVLAAGALLVACVGSGRRGEVRARPAPVAAVSAGTDAGAALATPTAPPASYAVVDLMPRFFAFWDSAGGATADSATRLALFQAIVVRPESAFYARAGQPTPERVGRFLDAVPRDLAAMRALGARLHAELPHYQRAFRDSFPEFGYDGRVYFYPSLYVRDGGVMTMDGQPVLMFGVDMIARLNGPDARLAVLFHHELFHLHHGALQRATHAARKADASPTATPLWARSWSEGLATYVSARLNPDATLLDLLLQDSALVLEAPVRERELAARLLDAFGDTTSEAQARWFQAFRTDLDQPARAGYFLGYRVAERVGAGRPLHELAALEGEALRAAVHRALTEIAGSWAGRARRSARGARPGG